MGIMALYLAAVVAANLVVTWLGPEASVATAFLFIGLNITARDRLHDAWRGSGLRWKMAALIAGGAGISYAMNQAAAQVALASFAAFALSESADALVYDRLRDSRWAVRVNGSNVVSAAVDSVVFPTLAFGALMPFIVAGQFCAKVFGGAMWSWVLRPRVAGAVAVMVLFAAPASGQVVSVQAGRLVVDDFADDVVELYVAAPPIMGVRPNFIVSKPLAALGDDATYLAQLSLDPWRALGFDAGIVDTPFADPELTLGVHAIRSVGPFALTIVHSYQPESRTQTTVVKVGVTWFRE